MTKHEQLTQAIEKMQIMIQLNSMGHDMGRMMESMERRINTLRKQIR